MEYRKLDKKAMTCMYVKSGITKTYVSAQEIIKDKHIRVTVK